MTPTTDEISAQLKAAGVEVTAVGSPANRPAWTAIFETRPGRYDTCILLLSGDGQYFLIYSHVGAADLNKLAADVLRSLIRESSGVKLAKLEYFPGEAEDGPGVFFATSECSTETYNGEKLRRRMEKCVQLADKARAVLG